MFKGERVFVSRSMQPEFYHPQLTPGRGLGAEKCKRRARDVLYWPGVNSEIEDLVSKCQIRNTH